MPDVLWGSRIGLRRLSCSSLDIDLADTMKAMSTSLMYLLLRQVLQTLSQLACDGGAKDV